MSEIEIKQNIDMDDNWLFNANEKHIRRIHDKLYKITSKDGVEGKQVRPVHNKIMKSLKFAIDNYHTPIFFKFDDLYNKYAEDTTINREVMLLFNAMKYDNEYTVDKVNNVNTLMYILDTDLTFIDKDVRDSIVFGFLEALTSKISGKPNIKFILEHYKDVIEKINSCTHDTENEKTFGDKNIENRKDKRILKLDALKDIIDKCLYIEYYLPV